MAALINAWQLSPNEAGYINRQQGESCTNCGANLRSIALADALCALLPTTFRLVDYGTSPEAALVKVLELNEAGSLHATLKKLPQHIFGAYPHVDMNDLPYEDQSSDPVIHSVTLEHVPNPIQ